MKYYYRIKDSQLLSEIEGIVYVKLWDAELKEENVYVYGGDVWKDEDDADRYILQSVVDDSINPIYDRVVDVLVRRKRPWNC